MDTNKIKKLATEARNILKAGIEAKILTLGFDRQGAAVENMKPQLVQGGAIWKGGTTSEWFYYRWMSLSSKIGQKGIREVCEEAAYTWFNRLTAIRILQKNGLIEPVLAYTGTARTPRIVDEARSGRMSYVPQEDLRSIRTLLDDDTKVTEQFAFLITAWCHTNPIISSCFGGIEDYTELLIPNNILAENGFIDLLNSTGFISDEDFHSPELIGWLYQFYISERKDEVFASFKNGRKAEADDIPAATQIFTPNWIVKYMVQNTVGRIYLDHTPYSTDLKRRWQYLVEPSQLTPQESILHYDELTDLKVADLTCGSGHILDECFDLLYDLYISEGYSRTEAIENIFRHNLTGVDIDPRARQLSMFSLLLKACQREPSFADAHILPKVLTMPTCDTYTWRDINGHFFCALGIDFPSDTQCKELDHAFTLLKDASTLGSILKFDISPSTRQFLTDSIKAQSIQQKFTEDFAPLIAGFELILALTDSYSTLVMNPPYMGGSNMNSVLSKYVKDTYPDSKSDLFSVFMDIASDRLSPNGKYGMINMQNWMFLSSFENLRRKVIDSQHIESMLHLGPRTFDELSGEVVQNTAFVIGKDIHHNSQETSTNPSSPLTGTYYRLVDGKNCHDKELMFLQAKDPQSAKILYPSIPQSNFEKIPGCPIGYWVSEKIIEIFTLNLPLSAVANPCVGLQTADNGRFLRLWFEVAQNRIGFGFNNAASAADSGKKWFPYNKGGGYRRWYGLNELVINWHKNGEEIKSFSAAVIRNPSYYFRECITFPRIGSDLFYARYSQQGFVFDCNGPSCFPKDNMNYILGYLNSSLMMEFLTVLCPTLSFQIGDSFKVPFSETCSNSNRINTIVDDCIAISKQDWDAHETSWDFQQNELVALDTPERYADTIAEIYEGTGIQPDPAAPELDSLQWRMDIIKQKWESKFERLHSNEEELNRQFIDIYGLSKELTPEVPLCEITILQQGEITIENEDLIWHDDVLIKQLISYAVGVWMGRYRLDRPGLHIAHPEPTDEELAPYTYHGENIVIDDDGILPLMAGDCGFSDNATLRFSDFVRQVFGDSRHVENLNFAEKCLGKTVEQYFIRDFWKDHKKMYQNRPIYWLFSSRKGAFQCLTYMYRMNPFTAERVRVKYLLPYIDTLQSRIHELDQRAASLSTAENRQLLSLTKSLEECREYHDRLQVIADQQITLDLDDGVLTNYAKFGDILAKLK